MWNINEARAESPQVASAGSRVTSMVAERLMLQLLLSGGTERVMEWFSQQEPTVSHELAACCDARYAGSVCWRRGVLLAPRVHSSLKLTTSGQWSFPSLLRSPSLVALRCVIALGWHCASYCRRCRSRRYHHHDQRGYCSPALWPAPTSSSPTLALPLSSSQTRCLHHSVELRQETAVHGLSVVVIV